jgi:uncharacterized coiled-coil protein SlyX
MSVSNSGSNNSYDDELIQQLINRIDELEATVNEQADTIDDLEEQLSEHQQHSGKERAELSSRISDVEEASNGGEGNSSPSDGKGVDDNSTPLEQVCALPEPTANSSLSSNQRRARFVATDINDYAKRCTAGRTISSSDIATILKSGTDCKGRTQTVARVMEFLDKLGGNNVKVVKRRGTKRVVFDEDYADRLTNVEPNNARCDSARSVGVI